MDALKIKTLEEDNLFLQGQVQLLEARNRQLELRIAQLSREAMPGIGRHGYTDSLRPKFADKANSESDGFFENSGSSLFLVRANWTCNYAILALIQSAASRLLTYREDHEPGFAFIPTFKANGIPPVLLLEPKPGTAGGETIGIAGHALLGSEDGIESQPITPTASSIVNASSSRGSKTNHHVIYRGPAIDTTRPTPPSSIYYDPPTPRQTPVEARLASGVPSSSIVRISGAATVAPITTTTSVSVTGARARAKTIGFLPTSTRAITSSTVAHPDILKQIFTIATDTELRSLDPFFQDSTNTAWNASVRLIKNICLVSKDWHAAAIGLLYTNIRLRRIPQLSALVSTLEHRTAHRPAWASKSYGSYTTSLDVSFYIPPEWNNLYVDDMRRLIACVPNLQCYRSRPMLPALGPRPVPTPILVCLADTRNELLSELELSEQEGPQMPDLIRLLQSCTYLEKLTLGKYVFDGGLGSNTPVLRLPSLKSLEVKVTGRLTPGSFASLPSPHVLAEAAKWDLPHLESLILILHDEIKVPFTALHPFLNIHGHKLRQLSLQDANPLMRSPSLQISGVLSRCPNLEEFCVVASSTASLILARPHHRLEKIRFIGVAPGSRRDGAGGDLGHLLAFAVDNVEGRGMFPSLKEIVLVGEEDDRDEGALRFLWEDAVGPNLQITFVELDGRVKVPTLLRAVTRRADWAAGVSEEDEEEWLPDEDSDEDSAAEDEYSMMAEDDEKSDDETVRDSRSGRGRDDDQVDHTTALLIFQDSQTGVKRMRHSFSILPSLNGGLSLSLNPSSSSRSHSHSLSQSHPPGWGQGLSHSAGPGSASTVRHATAGSRFGSVDLKRTSLGPGGSRPW